MALTAEDVLIEQRSVSTALIGDLVSQLAMQRAINRSQEEELMILRRTVEEQAQRIE